MAKPAPVLKAVPHPHAQPAEALIGAPSLPPAPSTAGPSTQGASTQGLSTTGPSTQGASPQNPSAPALAATPRPGFAAYPGVAAPAPNLPPVNLPPVKPTAGTAQLRPRHGLLVLSFILLVLLPVGLTAYYLWGKAVDQYASTVGFSVRREEAGSALDLLGGISGLSNSSSSDTDILYEFLQSQKLVADMERKLGLRAMWSTPQGDPFFVFDAKGSIEDLVDYWARMVRISYDSGTGLLEVRVLAFTPTDATAIATALFAESSEMINDLSTIAREDAIRYSREELETAQGRLKAAREAITRFRVLNQLVDPATDIQTQAGLLGGLQSQLTAAQIEVDLLGESTQANDPRLLQAIRRVEVIEVRIAAERSKVGIGTEGEVGEAYASLVGEYERLAVDREFAERAYVASLASYDGALAEARRKSRYLAAHILPTIAEVARYPERGTLLGVIALFLLLSWAIGVLVVYSLKDRR